MEGAGGLPGAAGGGDLAGWLAGPAGGGGALRALRRGADDAEAPCGVPVPARALARSFPALGRALLGPRPAAALAALDAAARRAQRLLLEEQAEPNTGVCKVFARARLEDVPGLCAEAGAELALHLPSVGSLGASHVGRLVAVRGTVIRASPPSLEEHQRLLECARCRHRFLVELDPETGEMPPGPSECPSNSSAAGNRAGRQCAGRNFRPPQPHQPYHRDHQVLRVQEQMRTIGLGTTPKTVTVVLTEDLVDLAAPGDDVEVAGVITRRWDKSSLRPDARCHVDLALHANSVQVLNPRNGRRDSDASSTWASASDDPWERTFWSRHTDAPMEGRDEILRALCPQVYGLRLPKLAVALTLVGGDPLAREGGAGPQTRGDCHLLLVGDPGTGKSQLMKCAARLSARSVLTTGKGSSGVGLTAAAVKDSGQWVLEAGALVLADGGLCCIDEFGGIREADRASLHEAMEQQTVSVAKAGLVVKLNTRTAVLAVTNPVSGKRVDPTEDISSAAGIPGPLLSRFDMVLCIRDPHDESHDRRISNHVLGLSGNAGDCRALEPVPSGAFWTRERLAEYVARCRAAARPEMSREAERLLSAYYQMQRMRVGPFGRAAGRTTLRLLESLVRVAQAHARFMCRGAVTLQDAVVSILLSEAATQTSPLLGSMDRFLDFPERPDREQAALEEQVLRALQPALDSLGPFHPPRQGCEDLEEEDGDRGPTPPPPFEQFVELENLPPNVAATACPGSRLEALKRPAPEGGFEGEPLLLGRVSEPRQVEGLTEVAAPPTTCWEDADDLDF